MGEDTEIIDKLFLELSQFTNAETGAEIMLRELLDEAVKLLNDVLDNYDIEPNGAEFSRKARAFLRQFSDDRGV